MRSAEYQNLMLSCAQQDHTQQSMTAESEIELERKHARNFRKRKKLTLETSDLANEQTADQIGSVRTAPLLQACVATKGTYQPLQVIASATVASNPQS